MGARRGGSLLAVALAGTHGGEKEKAMHTGEDVRLQDVGPRHTLYMPMFSSYQLTSRRRLSSVRLSHLLRSASSDSSAAMRSAPFSRASDQRGGVEVVDCRTAVEL